MVAHDPLHRARRAGFPHPALASGDDAELKVVDKRFFQPRQLRCAGSLGDRVLGCRIAPPISLCRFLRRSSSRRR